MVWTEELKSALQGFTAAGLSGQQIAKLMSAQFGIPFTRSMIGSASIRYGYRLLPPAARKGKKCSTLKPKTDQAPAIEMKPLTIWQLTTPTCRFPLWPHELKPHTSYLYCGALATRGPYCAAHAQVCYNPVIPRLRPPPRY